MTPDTSKTPEPKYTPEPTLTPEIAILFSTIPLEEIISWDIQTIDRNGKVGGYSSLVIDTAGTSYIVYFDDTEANLKV